VDVLAAVFEDVPEVPVAVLEWLEVPHEVVEIGHFFQGTIDQDLCRGFVLARFRTIRYEAPSKTVKTAAIPNW